MRQVALAFAALAAVSLAAPAEAQVTNYSVTGNATGTFSLSYDGSNYTLTSLDLVVGNSYDTSNAGIAPNGSYPTIFLGADVNGVDQVAPPDDFFYLFDPSAAAQTSTLYVALAPFSGGQSFVDTTQVGSNGATTDYSVSGPMASGSFSLDYDSGTSSYSLSSLNFILGNHYDTSNAGLAPNGSYPTIFLGADAYGVDVMQGGAQDFFFLFDPTQASQTMSIWYSFAGLQQEPQPGSVTITQVAAAAVPEPASWAMMLLGFGAVGLAVRRRERRFAAA